MGRLQNDIYGDNGTVKNRQGSCRRLLEDNVDRHPGPGVLPEPRESHQHCERKALSHGPIPPQVGPSDSRQGERRGGQIPRQARPLWPPRHQKVKSKFGDFPEVTPSKECTGSTASSVPQVCEIASHPCAIRRGGITPVPPRPPPPAPARHSRARGTAAAGASRTDQISIKNRSASLGRSCLPPDRVRGAAGARCSRGSRQSGGTSGWAAPLEPSGGFASRMWWGSCLFKCSPGFSFFGFRNPPYR